MTATAATAEQPRRADVTRNERLLVEAATATLGADPRASMADVARAAGLNRATLYRHFGTREDLLAAIRTCFQDDVAVLVEALPARGPVLPSLARLVESGIDLGIRYRYLAFHPGGLDADADTAARAAMVRHITRGQRRGELDRGFDPRLVTHLFVGLVTAAITSVVAGELDHDTAVAQTVTALEKALRAG